MKNFLYQYKNPIVYLALFFLALFVYTKIAGPIPFHINSVTTQKQDLFTAQGTGEAFAVPDTAIISAGVTANGATVAEAQNKINAASKKIIDAIKKEGVDEKDIKTNNYSIYPTYGTSRPLPLVQPDLVIDDNQRITGYTASQNLEIKVKDIDKVNSVVDSATANGANVVGNVTFGFTDEKTLELENVARREAVKNAKERAKGLADAAGIRLGRIINVFENGSTPRSFQQNAVDLKEGQGGEPTEITPGENNVTITVSISYEIY